MSTMPLSIDEATKRFESYSQNIQDSILIMESFMGSHESISFDLAQVISNLESIDTHTEEKNVTAHIKVLEEYQRMLVMERKRRSIKEVIEGKVESADFKTNLKKRRRSQRLGIIFKPNVLPAMATAGQMPPPMSARAPTASQMPPPMSAQAPAPSQIPPQMSAQAPAPSQIPPQMSAQAPAPSQIPPQMSAQAPIVEEIPSPNAKDELMLEL